MDTIIIEIVNHYEPTDEEDRKEHRKHMRRVARNVKRFARDQVGRFLIGDTYVYDVMGERT